MPTSAESLPPIELASTGIEGLDDILGGGLPRDHFYVLHGQSGVGKTTLALQFLLAGSGEGEPALHITLSESPTELAEIARSHGWALGDLAIFEPPTGARAADRSTQTMFPPAEVELEEITRPILAEVERLEPRRVVIDSISEIRLLARDPLRYRRELLALKRFFAGRDCTVVIIDSGVSEADFMLAQTIAHGVFVLERAVNPAGVPRGRLAVSKLRARAAKEGFHDYRVNTGGIEVFPRLVAGEPGDEERVYEPLPSSIPALDRLVGGGLDFGTSTLFIGPAGAGKSTLAALYAASAADRGDAAAIYLFAERRATLLKRSSLLGIDVGDHLRSGRISIEESEPEVTSTGEIADRVRRAVETRGARVVVLDSLNGLFPTAHSEPHLSLHLHELLGYLSHRGVATIMVLAQRGLVGTLQQVPIDVSYLADAVLLLRFFEARGMVRQAVSMLKKRSGAHERAIRELRITAAGVEVGPSLTEFQGILTGVPTYHGDPHPLFSTEEGNEGDER